MASALPGYAHAAQWLWALFLVSWCAAMPWTARATARGSRGLEAGYYLAYAVAFGLLFASLPPLRFGAPLWRGPAPFGWALVVGEAAAFLFAWWARLHLGRLWSGMLTLREGHRVVESGPYRLVRHPIYTGFIGAGWALAMILATPAALAGAIVLSAVMALKAKREERLLRHELGAAAYDDYASRTPMIVPFARR